MLFYCDPLGFLVAAEEEISPDIELLLATMLREPQPDLLVNVARRGHAKILDDLLKKWPDQVWNNPEKSGLLLISGRG